MKKIDIHAHTSMWENSQIRPGVAFATPEQIKEAYDEIGIDKGFLLPLLSPEFRCSVQTSEEMEYLSNKYPDTFYWFCNLDPRMGEYSTNTDFSQLIEPYKKRGAIGLGELISNMYIDDPLMDNLFYHCAQCDMPVTIHISPKVGNSYGVVDDLGLPRLEKMLKKHPKLKILGHSQCFWSEISDNVNNENRNGYPTGKVKNGRVTELMREYPNLYCDLSAGSGYTAMSRDPEFTYRFIEEFSDRLLFGTDIVRAGQGSPLSLWLDEAYENGCITEENYYKVCRGNAINLYKLNIE